MFHKIRDTLYSAREGSQMAMVFRIKGLCIAISDNDQVLTTSSDLTPVQRLNPTRMKAGSGSEEHGQNENKKDLF